MSGRGLCLDLGCGTGLYFDVIRASGRAVVGLDRSADQLRIAQRRGDLLVQADAAALPFADAMFSMVTAFWVSTDVDDFAPVVKEAVRVMKPDGVFVFYGAHPCFNGPHAQVTEDGSRIVHPTYRDAGWHQDAPWWGDNIRRRVGMRHLPLAELFNAITGAGLVLTDVLEPGHDPVPSMLALRARRQ